MTVPGEDAATEELFRTKAHAWLTTHGYYVPASVEYHTITCGVVHTLLLAHDAERARLTGEAHGWKRLAEDFDGARVRALQAQATAEAERDALRRELAEAHERAGEWQAEHQCVQRELAEARRVMLLWARAGATVGHTNCGICEQVIATCDYRNRTAENKCDGESMRAFLASDPAVPPVPTKESDAGLDHDGSTLLARVQEAAEDIARRAAPVVEPLAPVGPYPPRDGDVWSTEALGGEIEWTFTGKSNPGEECWRANGRRGKKEEWTDAWYPHQFTDGTLTFVRSSTDETGTVSK